MSLRLLMILGLVLMVVGGVLALDYYVNPSRHTKIIRYGDFVATLRIGQGIPHQPYGNFDPNDSIPLGGTFWDLKVFNITYNISPLYDCHNSIFVQMLAVISYPKEGDIFVTPWVSNSNLDPKIAKCGLEYPHRIEVNYVNVTLSN